MSHIARGCLILVLIYVVLLVFAGGPADWSGPGGRGSWFASPSPILRQ